MRDTSGNSILGNAGKAALAAVETLRQLNLAPVPRHLAVLYAYHAGGEPMLRARLDRALADPAPIRGGLLDELHAAFIAAQAPEHVEPLSMAAGELIDLAGRAGGQVQRFESLLTDAAGRIEDLDGPDLRRLAGGLVTLTRQLAQQSAEVSARLHETERRLHDLKQQIGDVDRAAHTDALTGLGNRRSFEDGLATLVRQRRIGGRPFAIALLRVDQYRQLSETYGHQVGDAIIRAAATHLLNALREADRPARIGTDEFAVLLPGAGLDAALRVAERVRADIGSHDYMIRTSNERIGAVTLSAAAACHLPDEAPDRLLRRADAALEVATSLGGNRTVPAPED
ncbi:GGDEF domain-containing protein [Falsiroseomonas sp. HW251]|uniref:GGDEF domain-containing protein n=1 Tax=Falsiroseomonas sp. HW251 TaxID=3390998 RepID=UPI003D31A60D